jgi:hypothetical protein
MSTMDLLPEFSTVQLLRGDDYRAAHGRALQYGNSGNWPDLSGAVVEMGLAHRGKPLRTIAGTVLEPSGEFAAVQFELMHEDTFDLPIGAVAFDVQATLSDARIYTLVRGHLLVEADVTLSPTQILPPAPANLEALPSHDQITLQWTLEANNEYGFEVQKLSAGGKWVAIGNTGAAEMQFVDHGLSPNMLFAYRVRAYNAMGFSAYSNEIRAWTLAV